MKKPPSYKINYTISNVSKRTKESRIDVRSWLLPRLQNLQTCIYCPTKLTMSNFSIDHILPIARGGDPGLNNCQLVCKSCNGAKCDLTDDEYKQLLSLLNTLGVTAQKSVMTRLKYGGRLYG